MGNSICFDIGGTFVKYGIIDDEGNILVKNKFPSPENDCKNRIPEQLVERIRELEGIYDFSSIGISTAGQVDSKEGVIVYATENLPGYTGTRLSEVLTSRTGLRCCVENDVNAAALGEMWKGAGAYADTFLCLTLGTGIGGAIIINRRLYKGAGGGAGEFGHMILRQGDRPCNCGMVGCYERYASTSAFIRNYKAGTGGNGNDISGEMILEEVRKGNKPAVEIYDRFLEDVTAGLASLTHIFDPGLIIVGGGISAQGKPFFDELNRRLKKMVMHSYADHTTIVQAALQNDAGLLGAKYLTS